MKRYEYNYGKNPEGALSTISGYATETTNFGETAFGILNKSTRDEENFTTPEVVSSSTATLFSVGNGTDHDSRKNIIELKADGTVYINGVGQYDGTNPGEATSIADEFQGIHDDITGLNEDVDRIDNTIESIHISEDNANLIYTLLVDGQERGTINIPRDQFLKNVSYNEETNNLEFTFIVRGENNEEVEKQVNVNMTDLEDIYSAGDGLNLENKQFSVKVDADTQPYIEVSSNGVKIIGIDEALDKKVSWDESKKVITLPADGSISALRNNGLEGGVLVCQRTYDDGATYVTEIGTTKNNLTLNSIERPKIDFADGTSQNIAYESEVKSLQDRMSTAETDIDNLEGRMDTAESDIDTIQSDLSDLVGDGEGSVQDQIKTALEDYLPLSGGTVTGILGVNSNLIVKGSALLASADISAGDYVGLTVHGDSVLGGTPGVAVDASNIYILNNVSNAGTGSEDGMVISKEGVSISGKSDQDLLNAAGGTTSISDIIAKVPQPDLSSYATKEEVGSNVYIGANYISKETNLTDAVLQLDVEIKATNDNLALEHTNAEATYVKKTDLSGYLPLTGGKITGDLTINMDSDGVNNGEAYMGLFRGRNGVWECHLRNDPDASVGNLSRGFEVTMGLFSVKLGMINTRDNGPMPKLIIDAGTTELEMDTNGITVSNKSSSDLLNAAGGTVSIQDIISQVTVPTKVSELTNDSGYQTESQVAAKVSALVDSAPETLDTLNELAAALGDDPNFATTVTNQIAQKADKTTATTSADGLMSAADKSKLDSIETSTFATKAELDDYLPLTGGTISGVLSIKYAKYRWRFADVLTITDERNNPYVTLDVPSKSFYIINRAVNNTNPNYISTGIQYNGFFIGDHSNGIYKCFLDQDKLRFRGYDLDSYSSSYDKELLINIDGISIKGKTTSDLLNAAGGTTTLKTINGESLLGSGDITTPTPTVNAASGTKTIWTGTQSAYEAVPTKDANTLYFITEG